MKFVVLIKCAKILLKPLRKGIMTLGEQISLANASNSCFSLCKIPSHWAPCNHDTVRPLVEDGGDDLQIWGYWISSHGQPTLGGPPEWGLGWLTSPHPYVTKFDAGPWILRHFWTWQLKFRLHKSRIISSPRPAEWHVSLSRRTLLQCG
jgi:hypothetical protein